MQKRLIVVVVLLVGTMLFFIFQNSSLKNENLTLIEQLEELNRKERSKDSYLNKQAKEVAKDFIKGYFNYNGRPQKSKIDDHVTQRVLEKLNFGGSEKFEDANILSKTKNIKIYYGESIESKRELTVIFDNEIYLNNIESTVLTFMTLEILCIDGDWKVNDFKFYQL